MSSNACAHSQLPPGVPLSIHHCAGIYELTDSATTSPLPSLALQQQSPTSLPDIHTASADKTKERALTWKGSHNPFSGAKSNVTSNLLQQQNI
jgi:hypothetical protein